MAMEGKMVLRVFALEHGVWEILQGSEGVNDKLAQRCVREHT